MKTLFQIAMLFALIGCSAGGLSIQSADATPAFPRDLVQAQQTAQAANVNLSVYLTAVAQQTQVAQTATMAPLQTSTARAERISAEQTAIARTETASASKTSVAQTQVAIAQQTTVARTETASVNQTSAARTQIAEAWTRTAVPSQTNVAATETRAAYEPTRLVIEAQTQTKLEQEKAERDMTKIKTAMGWVIGVTFSMALIWLMIRVVAAIVHRLRTHKDPVRGFVNIGEPDWRGRVKMLTPSMSSGPVTIIDGTDVRSYGADSEFARREQIVRGIAALPVWTPRREVTQIIKQGQEELRAPPPQITISKPVEKRPLELSRQPSPLALPVGVKQDGSDLWIELNHITHALVAGSSGMGKSRLLHAWIQSIRNGGRADVSLFDGKGGIEFERYAGSPRTQYIDDDQLAEFLQGVIDECERRGRLFKPVGATSLDEYNERTATEKLPHQLLIIDEIKEAIRIQGTRERIDIIARTARATGVHLVSATQHPNARTISQDILANSILRIALSVPHSINSVAVLGHSGAEKLGGEPGRMLIDHNGQSMPVQAYVVSLPNAVPVMTQSFPEPQKQISGGGLTDDVVTMVRWAIEWGGGLFVVTRIARELGIRPSAVTEVALDLEAKGLLSEVIKDESGQNLGRRVTDRLASMMGNVESTGLTT